MPLIHFLLVYNNELGHLVDCKDYTNSAEAVARYTELEREYAGQGKFEIVLVGADSLDTIKRTHGQYFAGDADAIASPYLAGV
jgi:hypothetical protein